MTVIDEYLQILSEPTRDTVTHMYTIVRQLVPDRTEELSYAMPAVKYRGKGLIAIMVNKDFMSVYPFCNIERLGLDLSAYDRTTGSIHFTLDRPISDALLRAIVTARLKLIE